MTAKIKRREFITLLAGRQRGRSRRGGSSRQGWHELDFWALLLRLLSRPA
jgi:hypothetical protein